MATKTGEWHPDYAVPPGAVLAEHLEARSWSQADLARRLGRTPKMISELISGKNPIEPDTALALERVIGLKAEIWTGMEADWQTFQAREADRRLAEKRTAWLDGLPMRTLRQAGVVPPHGSSEGRDAARVREAVLAFFGVASEEAYETRWASLRVAYRLSKSRESSVHALRTWLRLGEQIAERVQAPAYDEAAARALVPKLRALTLEEPERSLPAAKALCLQAGLIAVIVPRMEKACLSGAAYRRADGRGVVQLSMRHKSNDHFWFTFLHEIGHLILHRRLGAFVDDAGSDLSDGKEEQEADDWAEDALVGRKQFVAFLRSRPCSAVEIQQFALSAGVHPGVVVGMLQHRKVLPWTHLNGLKQKLDPEYLSRFL